MSSLPGPQSGANVRRPSGRDLKKPYSAVHNKVKKNIALQKT
jgi:hypothetical protein